MKKRYILLYIIPLFLYTQAEAQRWKKTRYEVWFGTGIAQFMGDLGGGAEEAKHFLNPQDVDLKAARPAVVGGIRYKLFETLAVRANFGYARLSGSDEHATELSRRFRNLSFVSNTFETSLQFELSLIKEPIGTRYKLYRKRRRGSSRISNIGINLYIFGGIGAFYFNPKVLGNDGAWHEAQPLSTEGQGITKDLFDIYADQLGKENLTYYPTSQPYNLLQVSIPVGIGVKKRVTSRWCIGLEIAGRYTFTDYVDDVSGQYFDPAILALHHNTMGTGVADLAVAQADRHIDLPPLNSSDATTHGAIRGNPDRNDMYFMVLFNVSYKLKTSRSGLPKF